MREVEIFLTWIQQSTAFLYDRRIVIGLSIVPLLWLSFGRTKNINIIKKKRKRPITEHATDDEIPGYSINHSGVPMLYGLKLQFVYKLMSSSIGKLLPIVSKKIQQECEIVTAQFIPEKPTAHPIHPCNDVKAIDANNGESDINLWKYLKTSDKSNNKFEFITISDYVEAYRSGRCTPNDVAIEVINAINSCENMNPKMNIIVKSKKDLIMQLANESTLRYKNNAPLSVFDGIPVCLKDSFNVAGYSALHGTPFLEEIEQTEESESGLVRKLRDGGAMIIGICNMHQIGIGVTGYNDSRKHGTARNPHDPDYLCGGSSSGSAGAVAAGLCPLSLGGDAGGSCRIPAAACGVVGVKATFGRLSSANVTSFVDTVAHPGYLCPSVRDAAVCYGFLAGPDTRDPYSLHQPKVSLHDFDKTNLSGIKIGIDWNFFKDVQQDVAETCMKAVDFLKEECGAEITAIRIPELDEGRMAHTIICTTEFYSNTIDMRAKHGDEMGLDAIMTCEISSAFSSNEYLMAQKQRTRNMLAFEKIFEYVDCIITPTCASTIAKIIPKALATGLFDSDLIDRLTRFSFFGNLTGIPSMSIPVGYGESNMPIGLQVITKWWDEAMMFRVAHAVEGFMDFKRKPKVYFEPLK